MHFRSVGATNIDEQMKEYAVTWFNGMIGHGDKSIKFFEEKIRPEILSKFEFDVSTKDYLNMHRPALFQSLQYHVYDSCYTLIHYIVRSKVPGRLELHLQFGGAFKEEASCRLYSASQDSSRNILGYHHPGDGVFHCQASGG